MDQNDKEVLLRIHRNYTKQEIDAIEKQIVAKQELEIGILKSTVAELEYELKELSDYRSNLKDYKKSYRQSILDEYTKALIEELNSLRRLNKAIKIENEKLLYKVANLNLQLKQNKDE